MVKVKSRSCQSKSKVLSSPLPRLVPYNKLAYMLNEIEIGMLCSVCNSLCHDLEGGGKVGWLLQEVELVCSKVGIILSCCLTCI